MPLDGGLAWSRPTAQAISLEEFRGDDRSTKTVKLFHLQYTVYIYIYNVYSIVNVFIVCVTKRKTKGLSKMLLSNLMWRYFAIAT